MDLDAVVPLDEDSLLSAARTRTGLDDFGNSLWYESFQIFIKALKEEAELNLMGRLMTRSDLINMLAARLEIEETFKQHPEIEDEEITKPVMILGQARTGTSLLLNVLSQDLNNGSLRQWEMVFPCPPPERETYFTDPRIDRADHLIEQWNRVNPELVSLHEFAARVPTEASHAMTFNFTGAPFLSLLGQTPSHAAWVMAHPEVFMDGLRYQKRLLKLLQWKNPRKHWILKAPDAITYMPQLLEVYPDMNFVWNHRDPLKAAESTVHMYGNCMWVRSDNPMQAGVMEQMINPEMAAMILNQPIDWMESGVIPPERVLNIKFFELEKDPVGEVEKLYRQFNMELTPEAHRAMKQYMQDNPRSARPPSKFKPTINEALSAERAALKRYQEYFNIESEF
jgi:Sulfotransferase family